MAEFVAVVANQGATEQTNDVVTGLSMHGPLRTTTTHNINYGQGSLIGQFGGGLTVGKPGTIAATGNTLKLANFTVTQRDTNLTAEEGMLCYINDGTTHALQFYNGASWLSVATGIPTLQQVYDTGNTIALDPSGPIVFSNGGTAVAMQLNDDINLALGSATGGDFIIAYNPTGSIALNISAPNANAAGAGDDIYIVAQDGFTTFEGGDVVLNGGVGGSTDGIGGRAVLQGGDGGGANGVGGAAEVIGGPSLGTGNGGNVYIDGGNAAVTATDGIIYIGQGSGSPHTSAINIGNTSQNPPTTFLGTGVVTVASGRLVTGTHINNVGFKLPTNAGVPIDVTASAIGDVVWDSSSKDLYVRSAAAEWTKVGGASSADSLQTAYNTGNTIAMTDARPFDVSVGAGTAAISLDANGASNFTVDSNSLTLSTTTSGTLAVTSAGILDMDGTSVTVDASGAFSIDGAVASNVSTTAANLTLSTITSGTLAVTSAGILDMDGTSVTIDASGAFSIDGAGVSNVSTTAANLSLSTITSGTLSITSAGLLDIDGTTIFLDASVGGVSIDGAAASNFTTSAGALTLNGNGGVNVVGNAAEIDMTTTGAVDINSGAGTWDASTLSLDATDTTNLTMTANDAADKTLTISATNAHVTGVANIDVAADGLALQIVSNEIQLGTGEPAAGELKLAWGGAPVGAAAGYGKGTLWIDAINGILYINTGNSTSATWTIAGMQST